jgi:hypothetical protein
LHACFAAPVVGVGEAAGGAAVAPPLVSLGDVAGGVDPPHPMRIPPTAAARIVFVIIVVDLRLAPRDYGGRE